VTTTTSVTTTTTGVATASGRSTASGRTTTTGLATTTGRTTTAGVATTAGGTGRAHRRYPAIDSSRAIRSAIGGCVLNIFATPSPRKGLAIIRWLVFISSRSGGRGS
jgi:hypothetical protein